MRILRNESRTLVGQATCHVPVAVMRQLDRVSRKFLRKSNDRHLDEIDEVADILGLPGTYFLNVNFEWGCTVKTFQSERGPELVRVLDWGTPGLGTNVVMFKVRSRFGPWFTPSWPGFAGIVHGFAPRRFAVAMNQAPLPKHTGLFYIDWATERRRVWRSKGMLPAHLLRKVMEEASDYEEAYSLLASTPLCVHTIFSVVGVKDGEHAVIERTREAMRQSELPCAANHFSHHPDGHHRGSLSPFRAFKLYLTTCDPEDREFSWLKPPIMNPETVVAFIANPSQGTISACGIENMQRVTETLVLKV